MPNILIVEDNDALRSEIKDILADECLGDEIKGAGSAAEAMKALAAVNEIPGSQVDVALLDIHLPDINGLVLAQHIKQHLPNVRVIIHSNLDSHEYRDKAVEVGVDHFLSKRKNSLTELIELICRPPNTSKEIGE